LIAVSNTTPLRYLIAIEQEQLLPRVFEKIFVPPEVHEELTKMQTPERVRTLVRSLPGWYEVREVRGAPTVPFPATLHRGERQAILLAEDMKPDFVLIDEQVGRTVALRRNLPVSGTLGVLERADVLGLVHDFPGILTKLKTCGFFISNALEFEVLLRHGRRRETR
jgi:predicted nucleic acid-binding protein